MATPYSDLSAEVKAMQHELDDETISSEELLKPKMEAIEIFSIEDKVQIFFVSADKKVSTFSAPCTLRIFRFKDKPEGDEWVPTFIQVGGWSHPLIPGASPVLQSQNGAIMFPDVYADAPAGSAVGIVLAEDVPQDVTDVLLQHLQELTALKVDEQLPMEEQLGHIGRALVSGANYLAKGMEIGARKGSQLIEYIGQQQMEKHPAAGDDVKMGKGLQYTAKGAKVATTATVRVSGFVAKRVGKLTKATAKWLADKVDKPVTGTVVRANSGATPKSNSMHSLVDAARGGLIAFGTVYNGLEDNAKVLGDSLRTNSVTVVQHRYGQEAGNVYDDAVTAAGNAAMTYMNVSALGIKGIAKRTAKDTAKTVGQNVLDAHAKKTNTNE